MKINNKEFNKLINFVEKNFSWDTEKKQNKYFYIVNKNNDIRILIKEKSASIFTKHNYKFFYFENFKKIKEFKNIIKLIADIQ